MSQRLNLAEAVIGRISLSARPALSEPGRTWTYGELLARVSRVGGALLRLGVCPRDRVAVLMPDCLEAAASVLGAVWIGGIGVPISELLRPNDIRNLLSDSGASVALVDASLEPLLDEVRLEIGSLREIVVVGGARAGERSFEALLGTATPAEPAETHDDDPALILYSAGASEAPKGVLHSHGAPLASFRTYAEGVLGLRPEDRVFSTFKLASAFGLGAGLVFPLAAGAESILLPQQARSSVVFDLLRICRPTVMFATPSVYNQLALDLAPSDEPPLAMLRRCVSEGESLPPALADRISAVLGAVPLPCYGLTEAFHAVIAHPIGPSRPGSCGTAVPEFEARIVNEEGSPLPPDEIGTLEIKGPSLGLGYWNRPTDSTAVFRGEWLRTGDRFLADRDGHYFHCCRTDDLFKVSGKWVSPLEIEKTLLAHEAVWECAVVGAADEHGLTKPLAYVVPNVGFVPTSTLRQELIEYVKREIAPYKYPRWVEFVDSLPKGPHGTVLRYKLRARLPHKAAPDLG
ncbi:MAG: benzoate-CoA ligase family protein [Pseudomonadota bacterium]